MKDDIKKQFRDQFLMATGTIEGGGDIPVQIILLSASWHCVANRVIEFGCEPNEEALLVEWIPVGMVFTEQNPGELPTEAGVDKSQIPPRDQWIVFPKTFRNLPVYYKRGSMTFSL